MIINILLLLFLTNILISAVIIMNARGPITAAISLAFAFLNMAFVLIIMDFEFVALTVILVYIGAIIILFLFIIMLLHIKEIELKEHQKNGLYFMTLTFFYINFIIVILMVLEFENLLFLNDLAFFDTNYNYLIINSKSNVCIDQNYDIKLCFINGSNNWNNFLFQQKEIANITNFTTEQTLPKNFYYLLPDNGISLTTAEKLVRGTDLKDNFLPVIEFNSINKSKLTGEIVSKNFYFLSNITNDNLYFKIGKFINFKHLFKYNNQNIEPLLVTNIKNLIATNFKNFKPTLRSYNTNLELRTELHSLGLVMYTYGCIYLILVSVLLLIALLGAVILITLDTTEFIRLQQSSNQNSKGTNIHIS